MRIKNLIKLSAIIIFTSHAFVCQSQINTTLKSLSDSMSFENYVTHDDLPHKIESIEYDFSIINDSLLLKYTRTYDNLKYSDNKSVDTVIGKVAISDLKEFYVYSKIEGNEYYTARYSKLIVETLRQKRLIKQSHLPNYKDHFYASFYVPILKHQDTIFFQEIIELVDKQYNIAANSMEANCETASISINLEGTETIQAIQNFNLDSPILLNSNEDIDAEINKACSKFMNENNMNVLSGTLFIDANNKIEHVGCYEYLRLLSFQKQDSIHPVQQVILKTYGLGLNKNNLNKIIEILHKQDWSAGSCNGQKVKSAYDFLISGSLKE